MKAKIRRYRSRKQGSVLVLLVVSLIILAVSGAGLLTVAYGVRHRAVQYKSELAAMLAAEAGYEEAIFRMSQQPGMLAALASNDFDPTGNVSFQDAGSEYKISFDSFIGARPIYKIVSIGQAGMFARTVEVKVVQAITGWSSTHRIPTGTSSTIRWPFVDTEILDIPVHVNGYGNPEDSEPDMDIDGDPRFLQSVTFSESRYSSGGADKYASDMDCFEVGVSFNQPDNAIKNEDIVAGKIKMFGDATNGSYRFTPVANPAVDGGDGHPAVQLEFFVDSGTGYVQITKDCTVRGYGADNERRATRDYKIEPASDPQSYEKYDSYAYHYIPDDPSKRYTVRVDDPSSPIYVAPSYGGVEGTTSAQIFVDGNVIIGSRSENASSVDFLNAVKGKVRVVATGNIWLGNELFVYGEREGEVQGDGLQMPTLDNSNAIEIVSQGVIKVVDPGMSEYSTGGRNKYPGSPDDLSADGAIYEPVANSDGGNEYDRSLPRHMTVEASIIVGGGGWGAENVDIWSGLTYGGRKDGPGGRNYLYVRGQIIEAMRGPVGNSTGYFKRYYLDERLIQGIMPSDFQLSGKYVPAPAGWHDYRVD
ncbi:hypothetical protein ACFL1G_01870 [Planctomycetota bacterium]